jgi:hypothetical protein
MNAAVKTPTGLAPAQLLFGDAVHLERGILLPHKEVAEGVEIPVYLKKLLATQSDLIKIAQENQKCLMISIWLTPNLNAQSFLLATTSCYIIQENDLKR